MRWLAKSLATVGGLGDFPKVPGTAGSAIGMLVGWLLSRTPTTVQLSALGAFFLIGVGVSTITARDLNTRDPSSVVIDEVWGMWAVIVAVPSLVTQGWAVVLAFVLFRAFDIFKPPPLKQLERCPAGWGIMLDDAGAAVYTCLSLRLVLALVHSLTPSLPYSLR